MSTAAIDINDLTRLGEEAQLTEHAPQVLPEEPSQKQENPGIALIKALAAMLTDRNVQ